MVRAGIKTVNQDLHWPLITKSGVNDAGKKVHYYYNYTSQKSSLFYPHKAGTELTSGKSVTSGISLEIGPWDVLIVEEN
jgi:beta-galactosidase